MKTKKILNDLKVKKKPKDKEVLFARIPPELGDDLRAMANDWELSVNSIVTAALTEFVKQLKIK